MQKKNKKKLLHVLNVSNKKKPIKNRAIAFNAGVPVIFNVNHKIQSSSRSFVYLTWLALVFKLNQTARGSTRE